MENFTIEQLRNAAEELIEVLHLTDNKDDEVGNDVPITLPENSTSDQLLNFIKEAVEFIEAGDTFSDATNALLENLHHPEGYMKDANVLEEISLEDEIKECISLKELKEIAKAEPEFKAIRGKLSSFRDIEGLKADMLMLLNDPKTVLTEQKLPLDQQTAERIHEHNIEKKEVRTVVENYPEGKLMKVNEIKRQKPFNSLFDIEDNILEAVVNNMKSKGYDKAFPVILWNDIVIDGNTRIEAAIKAGIEEIPVYQKEFEDKQKALEYAIHNQRNRRNISDAEILRCIQEIDKPMTKKEAGTIRDSQEKIRTVEKTAKVLGISKSKVADARAVLKDEKAKKQVEKGEKKISIAAKEVRKKKKSEEFVKELKKNRYDAIAVVINEGKGTTISQVEFIHAVDDKYVKEFNGKPSTKETEKILYFVMPLLKALGILVPLEDGNIIITDFEIK